MQCVSAVRTVRRTRQQSTHHHRAYQTGRPLVIFSGPTRGVASSDATSDAMEAATAARRRAPRTARGGSGGLAAAWGGRGFRPGWGSRRQAVGVRAGTALGGGL